MWWAFQEKTKCLGQISCRLFCGCARRVSTPLCGFWLTSLALHGACNCNRQTSNFLATHQKPKEKQSGRFESSAGNTYKVYLRVQVRIQDFGQGGPAEFWPQGGLSPKFAQNRVFSLETASKLHDFEEIFGARGGWAPRAPLDPLLELSRIQTQKLKGQPVRGSTFSLQFTNNWKNRHKKKKWEQPQHWKFSFFHWSAKIQRCICSRPWYSYRVGCRRGRGCQVYPFPANNSIQVLLTLWPTPVSCHYLLTSINTAWPYLNPTYTYPKYS